MAYNATACLDKLTCANYVDFGKCQDRFGRFLSSEKDSYYLDVKFKVFKRENKRDFRRVQNLTMGEADFNLFLKLRNLSILAAENFAREENLSPVLIPTVSKDRNEQLKLAHIVIEVVEQANRKICVILLRCNVEKLESSHAQVRLIEEKLEGEVSTTCRWEI